MHSVPGALSSPSSAPGNEARFENETSKWGDVISYQAFNTANTLAVTVFYYHASILIKTWKPHSQAFSWTWAAQNAEGAVAITTMTQAEHYIIFQAQLNVKFMADRRCSSDGHSTSSHSLYRAYIILVQWLSSRERGKCTCMTQLMLLWFTQVLKLWCCLLLHVWIFKCTIKLNAIVLEHECL